MDGMRVLHVAPADRRRRRGVALAPGAGCRCGIVDKWCCSQKGYGSLSVLRLGLRVYLTNTTFGCETSRRHFSVLIDCCAASFQFQTYFSAGPGDAMRDTHPSKRNSMSVAINTLCNL